MLSPTVKIETNFTPGILGIRYGSVVVLGPMLVSAAALRGSNNVGTASNSGAVTKAPLSNVRRVTGRARVFAIDSPAVVSRSLDSSFFFIRSSSNKY
jgi:hypothetical protein